MSLHGWLELILIWSPLLASFMHGTFSLPLPPPRCLLEQLAEELCQAKQQNQAISQEAQQQLQTKAELMMKLERSQEALKCLQQQVGPHRRWGAALS